MAGPKLQPDIVVQLLGFRRYPFAFVSDVSQMYPSISVRPEDRKYQRSILNIPGQPVQEIQYNTVLLEVLAHLTYRNAWLGNWLSTRRNVFRLRARLLRLRLILTTSHFQFQRWKMQNINHSVD